MFKGLSKYLALACMAIPCLLQAVQVEDLHLPMTRTEADNTLSKDYEFAVLEDSTVRRLWHNNGRRIQMDFDIMTDQAICIRITYDKAVSKKAAEADVEKLCGKLGGKWSKTKKKAVERIGISEKSLLKTLDGGALLFLEGDKKKFTRLTYFAKSPKGNRWSIQPMSTQVHVTAMGSSSANSSGAAKALIQDEQRRKDTKPTAIAADTPKKPSGGKSSSSSSTPDVTPTTPDTPVAVVTPEKRKPATPTPPRKRPTPVVVQTPAPSEFSSGEVVETIEEIGFIKTSELTDLSDLSTLFDELDEAEDFDAKMVIIKRKITPTRAVVGGIILLVVIILIWSVIAKLRAKARSRANYKNILANGPQGGAPAAKVAVKTAKPKEAAPAPAEAPAAAPAEEAPPTDSGNTPE